MTEVDVALISEQLHSSGESPFLASETATSLMQFLIWRGDIEIEAREFEAVHEVTSKALSLLMSGDWAQEQNGSATPLGIADEANIRNTAYRIGHSEPMRGAE